MYRCQDCEFEFFNAETVEERHNLENPPYEKIAVCPNCKGRNFRETEKHYCRYCGRLLKKGIKEYCSKECRRRGEIMWREQYRRKNLYEKNSLIAVTRELEKYNKEHKTHYTYGTFVSKILPENAKEAQ